MRLISLCPSNTELLAYLGLLDSLLAVDDFSDWPKEVNELPRLGPDLRIDMDKVEALNPDLVFASLSVPGMERNIEELEKREIPYVIVPKPKTLAEVGESLLFIGDATNTSERAKIVYETYNQLLDQYRLLSEQVETPVSIYWEWWAKPIFTPGGENWLTEVSRLAGGFNIFQDQAQASVKTDWDEIKKRNPDVFCTVWVGVQKDKVNPKVILKRPQSEQLHAIKHNQLYILDEPLYCRPSPRLLLGLNQIASLLHPHLYPSYSDDVDPLLAATKNLF